MSSKEATARIKINRLLEEAGWRFFANADGPANIQLERGNPYVITSFRIQNQSWATREAYLTPNA